MISRTAIFLYLFIAIFWTTSPVLSQNLEPLIKGVEHYKKGEYEKALPEFLKADDAFPDNSNIALYIGLVYLQQKNGRAVAYFQKAVELKPDNLNAHFQLGAVLIQLEKIPQAIKHLDEVYTLEPKRNDLGYLLGLAYYKIGQYERALHFLETGKTVNRTTQRLTVYYTALAEQKLGRTKEARARLEGLVADDPQSPIAPLSERHRRILVLEERRKERLNIEFTVRAGYDTNVLLVPTENVFRLREQDDDSFFETTYFRADYDIFKRKKWGLMTSYALSQTFYNSHRNFDVQSHSGTVSGLWKSRSNAMNYELRPSYTFDHILVDYHWFLSRHNLGIPFFLGEGRNNLSIVRYDLRKKNFRKRPEALFAAEDRDAWNQSLGFTHYLHTKDWKHYMKAGYTREWELAKGDNWDYRTDGLLAGFHVTAPLEIKIRSDVVWRKKHYNNPNTLFGDQREDIDRIFSVTVSRNLTEDMTVFANFTRRSNSSNINLFEFRKNLAFLGVRYRYGW